MLPCRTEDDGLYWCGHEHKSIADAMGCVVPDGRTFIRAVHDGVTRSLDDRELTEYVAASLRFRGNKEKEYRRPPAPQHAVCCRNLQIKLQWSLN